MSKLILHLGYPKTGTSTLQNAVFTPLHTAGHIRYLGMGGFQPNDTTGRRGFFVALRDALYLESDDAFADQLPNLKSDYAKLKATLSGSGPMVLSNEHFLFSSWSSRQVNARIFPKRSAQRLAQVFDGEEVSLVRGTRDLPELMRSVYVQIRSNKSHVNHKLIDKTLSEYIERMCAREDFQSDMFDIDKSQTHYAKAFPNASLLTIEFDDFVQNQRASVAKLLAFIDLSEAAIETLAFPLEHSNAKLKSAQGTSVENIPSYLRPLARNDLVSPMLRWMSSFGPFKVFRSHLLRREEIPNLTNDQRQKIETSFRTP